MPRLPRLLLTLATVISLPLLIATLILYPRSYHHADGFWFNATRIFALLTLNPSTTNRLYPETPPRLPPV